MADRICPYCNLPVTLRPTAEERAKRHGGTAEFYRNLFPSHSDCYVKKRTADTIALMRILRGNPATERR